MRKRVHRDAVVLARVERHQLLEIEFSRRLEQHAGPVLPLSRRRVRCPGRVAQRGVEFFGVGSFVLLPFGNVPGERQFTERFTEPLCELLSQFLAIEPGGNLGLVGVHRLALDEQAFAGKQRCKFVVARGQRVHFGLDVEQARNEIVEMPGHGDQQFRFFLARQRLRLDAGGFQSRAQRRVGTAKKIEESGVESLQSGAVVEIFETTAEAELQFGLGEACVYADVHSGAFGTSAARR